MPEPFLSIMQFLLPGFITAWIFHGLTSHPKESQFERLVQALVFTAIVHAIYVFIEWIALRVGSTGHSIGPWQPVADTVLPILIAIGLGLLVAMESNADHFHGALRKMGITKKTGYPSVWYRTFYQSGGYVTLHLHDERRLAGWLYQWPSKVADGHFNVLSPSWLSTDEQEQLVEIPLAGIQSILIGADKVDWIEFRTDRELTS